MSVTLIAYPTANFIDDLTAWNNFNTRATADGADAVEAACFDCLYLRFAGLNAMPELAYVLDTMGGTDIAITYSIGDIEDVTKQRGSFSKTITLPNTPNNRACFAYAYNIQSFVGGFQPNKRIRAAMWEDGVQVFSGVLQLLSMSKTKGTVTYEVGLFTDNVSLFKAIEGNMLVNTAGVTGMNHTPTSGHVSGTWTASGALSSGYVYGIVDAAGFSDVQQGGSFTVPWWRLGPSIYVKKMVDLIFTEAGFRYSSTFFNSSLFSKLVIPYAAGTMPINLSGSNILAQSTGNTNIFLLTNYTLNFPKDTPAPFYDRPGYWVASSSTFQDSAKLGTSCVSVARIISTIRRAARPRWLLAFLTSVGSCAKVWPNSGIHITGSKPKPPVPTGSRAISPLARPTTSRASSPTSSRKPAIHSSLTSSPVKTAGHRRFFRPSGRRWRTGASPSSSTTWCAETARWWG